MKITNSGPATGPRRHYYDDDDDDDCDSIPRWLFDRPRLTRPHTRTAHTQSRKTRPAAAAAAAVEGDAAVLRSSRPCRRVMCRVGTGGINRWLDGAGGGEASETLCVPLRIKKGAVWQDEWRSDKAAVSRGTVKPDGAGYGTGIGG